MKLFIVGKIVDIHVDKTWEFQGVFSTKEKAEAACKDMYYFVGPALLDEDLPDESEVWPDAYFPITFPITVV